jgi:hypothetical protein
MGTGSFPGVKRPECGVDHLSPSSTKVKERVELRLHSPSGPTWPVLGRTLLYFTLLQGVKGKTSHLRRKIHAVGYIKQTSCVLGKVMDDRGREFQFVAVAGGFSLLQNTQTGPGAHQASYPSGCRGVGGNLRGQSGRGDKHGKAWRLHLTNLNPWRVASRQFIQSSDKIRDEWRRIQFPIMRGFNFVGTTQTAHRTQKAISLG